MEHGTGMGLNKTETDELLSMGEGAITREAEKRDSSLNNSSSGISTKTRSSAEEAIIERALSYPYARPNESYRFREGSAHVLPSESFSGLHFVLAIGSNASPEQLRRKYGDEASIPVVSVVVEGLDVVYTGMVSGYGSVPGTVLKSEGTLTSMHATLLTDDQLRRMHETEGAYYFCRLINGMGVKVLRDGKIVRNVYCYVGRVGALCNEQVYGLEEIHAENRRFATKSQKDMQRVVAELVGWKEEVEEFVLKNVESKQRREEVMKMMKGTNELEDCFEIVEDLGSLVKSIA